MLRRFSLVFIACSISIARLGAAATLNLQDFDPGCGQPQHNCRGAFQKAFQAEIGAGGGTVHLPAGTFLVDFPEVADNSQSGPPLQRESLLVVPPHVIVQGHLDAHGVPDTVIEWRITSIPVFVFSSASYSGMKDLHLRFIGASPTRYPYGDVTLLRAVGYTPAFPHLNEMSGGNSEMSSVVMLFDSEHCTFDDLIFDSAMQDNAHVFGFAINAKGKGVYVAVGGGGLTELAQGNRFNNIKFFDCVNAMLIGGQEDLLINNISGDRRGSSTKIGPGHLIYLIGLGLFKPNGENIRSSSKNITVTNVSEGPHTYSNVHSLGTLAVKFVNGGSFRNIVSEHPMGLIQTLYDVQNLTFEDVKWSTDQSCSGAAEFCGVPVIQSARSEPPDGQISNITFKKLALKSTIEPIIVDLIGNDLVIDGITIETPPDFRNDQKSTNSILAIKMASGVDVKNYTYIPHLSSFDPKNHYNIPFSCWGECSDVHADVEILWPKSIPRPPAGHNVVTPGFQDKRSGKNNSVSSRVETY